MAKDLNSPALVAEIPLERGGVLRLSYPPDMTSKDIIRIACVLSSLAEVVADD